MKIEALLQEILDSVSLRHHYKDDKVDQVFNYFDGVKLRGFSSFDLTIGVHQREEYGHILFIRHSLEEVMEDPKKIVPFVVFTLKKSKEESYSNIASGHLDKIIISNLSREEFEVFREIQQLIFQKIK
jgi:hypothetical protein